jgi:hypothetical protein
MIQAASNRLVRTSASFVVASAGDSSAEIYEEHALRSAETQLEVPSMEIPPKIQHAAQRLKEGHKVNRITVRDFLRHFGAERRGAVKVEAIRGIPDSLDLQTEPDFETIWIDEPI